MSVIYSLVTGANSGIGFETAKALAAKGHHLTMLCRNPEKGRIAQEKIIQETGQQQVSLIIADLAKQNDIRRVGAELREKLPRLDRLVNNAGTWKSDFELTEDKIETVFAINHVGPFLLTHELYPLLAKSEAARIINVSSDSHKQINGMYEDYFLTKNYHGLRSYAQSKLANILFTTEFNRRKPIDTMTINAVQPGLVQTDIGLKDTSWLHALVWRIRRRMSGNKTPEEGASTSIFLATEPAGGERSGLYWDECQPKPTSKGAQDEKEAERLWEWSLAKTGIKDYFRTA